MKVLQINSVCGTGSTGRIAVDLYRVLQEQGHECLIAYGRGKAPSDINTYRIGTDFSVMLHGILSRITDRQGFYSTLATKKLVKRIKEYKPDIIHLHNIHGYYLNIKTLFEYLASADIPVVWTLHDCWAFTGHCAHFDFVGCNLWKEKGCHDCPQKFRYPSSYICDHSAANYAAKKELFTSVKDITLITPSNWLAGIVHDSFLGKFPIEVIPNGIDLNIFKPTAGNFRAKYCLTNKKIILGVANIWSERKGLADFIKLADMLDGNYQIVLVGLSSRQKHSLPSNIIGITRTNDIHELAEIYTSSDVFVNPSVEETMGLTTVEAMACGTPAIVYNKTALPEAVNSKCGFVVDCNPESIRDAIYNMQSMENGCLQQAMLYEKRKQFSKYLNLYNKIYTTIK